MVMRIVPWHLRMQNWLPLASVSSAGLAQLLPACPDSVGTSLERAAQLPGHSYDPMAAIALKHSI